MLSGEADLLDLMVAANYAVTAADPVLKNMSGRLAALCGGTCTNVPISDTETGAKRVAIGEFYDSEEYRPKVRHVAGKSLFL